MKRITTLYLLTLLITSQFQVLEAQTLHRINNSALKTAKELQNKLNFNDAIFKKIHQAYIEYRGKVASLNHLANSKSGKKFGNKKHLLKVRLQKEVKKIFNNETIFNRYLKKTNQRNFTKLVEKPKYSKTVHLIDRNPSYSKIKTRGRPSKTVFLKE